MNLWVCPICGEEWTGRSARCPDCGVLGELQDDEE